MKSICNLIVVIVIYILFSFIFVNILEYSNSNFTLKPDNLCNLFSGVIQKDKFNLFISLLTIGGIFIAVIQWRYKLHIRMKTDLNGLLDEIKHNFGRAGNDIFVVYIDQNKFYTKINNKLKELSDLKYPNPDDPNFNRDDFSDCIEISTGNNIPNRLFELNSSFIDRAVISDNIFSLTKQRIYLNLGHLSYSISRHNINIRTFHSVPSNHPSKQKIFIEIKEEYYVWVHFRLAFMLVDLIMNTKEKYFIDNDYVTRIKGYIENTTS